MGRHVIRGPGSLTLSLVAEVLGSMKLCALLLLAGHSVVAAAQCAGGQLLLLSKFLTLYVFYPMISFSSLSIVNTHTTQGWIQTPIPPLLLLCMQISTRLTVGDVYKTSNAALQCLWMSRKPVRVDFPWYLDAVLVSILRIMGVRR